MDVDIKKEEPHECALKERPYQSLLVERVLKQNSIIYLPTGAGKTFVAIMAMMRMMKDVKNSTHEGGKRSIFLANTQALAHQQHEYIQKLTPFKCKVFTGDMNVDVWNKEKWNDEIEGCQVITATCQIILDLIRHGYFSFQKINLLVFDECHHARKNHPMHQLMCLYHKCPSDNRPRIVGLTGLLITSGSARNIISDLEALEATFGGKIATVSSIAELNNVLIHSTKPKEYVLDYFPNQENALSIMIGNIVAGLLEKVKMWRIDNDSSSAKLQLRGDRTPSASSGTTKLFHDFLYQLKDFGAYGASIAILSVIVHLELMKRSSGTIQIRNMLRVCITKADYIRHILIKYLDSTMDDDDDDIGEMIMQNSTPKVQKLLLKLQQISRGKTPLDLKCLVFVQRRFTAKNLFYIIKQFFDGKDEYPIVPEFMVGQTKSMPDSIESVLDQKWNKSPLNKFKHNKCNLIVASSVLEEGIDVQECNYVIAYDKLLSFRSYVQMKGRARMDVSEFVIMIDKLSATDYCKTLLEFTQVDLRLKNYTMTRTIDVLPHPNEIAKQFEQYPPPFKSKTGAILDFAASLALLNRYCMALPSDMFTIPFVVWKNIPCSGGKYLIGIQLPLQSTVKEEIVGIPASNMNLAQKHAAFKACRLLYEAGELTDNLLPITKKMSVDLVRSSYFAHWDKFPNENTTIAGTTKTRRPYKLKNPEEIYSAMPKIGVECYLYIMELKVAFEKDEINEHVCDLLSTQTHFGILTSKKLPKLARMPLFLTYGQVDGMISWEPIKLKIDNEKQLELLINFHIMLFKDMLSTSKDYLAKDLTNRENSYLVVPTTNNGTEIYWDLVQRFQRLAQCRKTSDIERCNMRFAPEDYENSVVIPWYNNDVNVRYVVRRVRTDLTPESPFPNSSYNSFSDYFQSKYNINVIQENQFLIECKPVSTHLDRFSYGMGEMGGKKKIKKMDPIILIPELCHHYRFPGDMWLKARFIPCMLHRLHYLLLAESIRVGLNSFLNINVKEYNPKPLMIDYSLKRNYDEPPTSLPPIVNPNTTEAIKVPVKIGYDSMISHTWAEHEEPVDVGRNLNSIFKIELDYYHLFISHKLEHLNINQSETAENFHLLEKVPAICDVEMKEKKKINIIDINEENINLIEQNEIIMAITSAKAQDHFNLERFEVLGDSFLKFGCSLFLLENHRNWNEGQLTTVKGTMVSNRNLLYHAILRELPSYLNVTQFDAEGDWQPPLLKVPQSIMELILENKISSNILSNVKLDEEEFNNGICKAETIDKFINKFGIDEAEPGYTYFVGQQYVADKTCADAMESFIGVCLKTVGIQKSFEVLGMLRICPQTSNLKNLLQVKLGSPRVKAHVKDSDVDEFLINYKDLEQSLGYTFNDRAYLLQALTHPSFPTNRVTGCYQQLEFMGDAIIDFLITCYIFEKCENITPGKLTDMRSALVNNITLGCLSVRYNFHKHMLSENASLTQAIEQFYDFQKTQKFNVTDQVEILLTEMDSQPVEMADFVEVPKSLGDIFEALIGAVFLDSNNNLNITWDVLYNLMSKEIEQYIIDPPINIVRRLYESKVNPQFSAPVVQEEVVLVQCKFTCKNEIHVVDGFGKNKDQAKIAAAKLALKNLQES